MNAMRSYRHTQRGRLSPILYAVAAVQFAAAWLARDAPVVPFILAAVGAFVLVLGGCFHHLTVADEGDALAVAFGPLPLFRRRIRYADMESAEAGRTTLSEGWGIHLSPQGGWVWNICGRECVVIRHGGTTRVGTDDAENLAGFLATRIPASSRR